MIKETLKHVLYCMCVCVRVSVYVCVIAMQPLDVLYMCVLPSIKMQQCKDSSS